LLCDPGGSLADRIDGAQKSFNTRIETGWSRVPLATTDVTFSQTDLIDASPDGILTAKTEPGVGMKGWL